jgi:hypothetical protein
MSEQLIFSLMRGAIAGAVAAATVDFGAFRTWKTFDQAKTYDWKLAGVRWLQGAVMGMLASVGIGQIG